MRILIAEDEVSIAKALEIMLRKSKYSVDVVHNGLDALDYINQYPYDGVVLDIMMPKMDGLTVLGEIRKKGNSVPVLFLTAKSEIEDRVMGLDAGADDYLSKPFATSEFLARMRALMRRSENYTAPILSCGNVTLDCGQYTLTVNNSAVRLNNKEFQLVQLFMRYPHQVFSSERLMTTVWGIDCTSEIDAVWTYIGFIRKKLKLLNADIEIKTIRGAGYALEEKQC